jgi:putative hydrolase of the HAD superfamily
MLRNVRWVLFDAVGTLIYANPSVADAYHTAAHRFGSRLTRVEIQQRFCAAIEAERAGEPTNEAQERLRWQRIVRRVIHDVNDGAEELFEQLWHHFGQPEHWRMYDDVGPALAQLAERGFGVGIASNFDGRLRTVASGHPPLALCRQTFLSSEIGYTKPDRRYFAEIERKLAVKPEEIALVGDDEVSDVAGARAAGWHVVPIDRELKFNQPGGISTLARLAELFD